MIEKMSAKDKQDEIEAAFHLFDVDGDGKITFEDLKQVAEELQETMTDEELREMLAAGATTQKDSKDKDSAPKYEVNASNFNLILNKSKNDS